MNTQSSSSIDGSLIRNIRKSIRLGNWQRVHDNLIELKQRDPLSVVTRGLELEHLMGSNQLADADRLAQQLIELFPHSSRILYLCGRLKYSLKKYKLALPFFKESHALHSNWMTEQNIGKTLTQLGEFDQAEPILLKLCDNHPQCLFDLAWLYERKENRVDALRTIKRFLQLIPNHTIAKEQLQRLQAQNLSSDQIIEEVDSLMGFHESIPIGLLNEYFTIQCNRGNLPIVRQWVVANSSQLSKSDAISLAWTCYHLKVYDLAFSLFLIDFAGQHSSDNYRNSLQLSAHCCGELPQLISIYQQYTDVEKKFFGRIKKLIKIYPSWDQ